MLINVITLKYLNFSVLEENMDKKLLFAIAFLLLIANAAAFGITPTRTTIQFTPGLEQNISFSVVNSEAKNLELIIYSTGELNQSVLLNENHIKINANEQSKGINYKLKLPSFLTPGLHVVDVNILEIPEKNSEDESIVGAVVGIIAEVYVYVPYPGKYAEAELSVEDYGDGRSKLFVIPVINRGKLDLINVRANIDIYNALGEKVDSINSASIPISSGKKEELVSKWNASVNPGKYLAKVALIADEQTINLEKEFNVGESLLELQQINVNNFKLGQIAKFEMLVENKWSDTIKDAYTETKIFDNSGQVMADFSSVKYDIPALSKQSIISFWDSAGAKTGTYDATLYLKYGEKSSQKNVKLKVSNDKVEVVGFGFIISEKKLTENTKQLITILIVVVALLIIVNLSWFIFLRKKLFKNK
jgi:hypothetical protein